MVRGIDKAAWIEDTIQGWVENSPDNTLKNAQSERAWAEPVVGFSRGNDPIYEKFREVVGPFHWTPLEWFEKTFPEQLPSADELTVISWILPQTEATKRDNREQVRWPAERWARSRMFGQEGNIKLAEHVVATLQAAGHPAMAPSLSPHWANQKSDQFGFASTWSERHAAYAAGLGTFALCDGFITPVGKAHRVGSVVARVQVSPTPRRFADHLANCLFFSQGTCRKCVERCPVGALSEAGHDKEKCSDFLFPETEDYVETQYGFEGYGCGLCQTGVPCESRIPGR